jgi:hypothetical protein
MTTRLKVINSFVCEKKWEKVSDLKIVFNSLLNIAEQAFWHH